MYNYSTWYSHIKVSVENYQRVRKGDKIGVIDVNQESSNCGCRMFGGQIDCSFYGPHLHFELRKSNGEPETLNGKVIGGYQIVTGRYAYDEYCYDHTDCNNATEDGKSCATKFIDLENNVTYCPSVMGSNTGELNKIVTKLRIAVNSLQQTPIHLLNITFSGGGYSYGRRPWRIPRHPFSLLGKRTGVSENSLYCSYIAHIIIST